MIFFHQYISYNSTKPYFWELPKNPFNDTILSSTLNIGFGGHGGIWTCEKPTNLGRCIYSKV